MMKKAGLIEGLRGAQGGYILLKKPADLSVADIWEALDGPVFHRTYQRHAVFDKRPSRQELLLGDVWEQAQKAERDVLGNITVEQLADRQRAIEAQRTPMYHI